ncbi:MAG: hypothetical protein OEY55_08300 [Acidimicrobiia bacterium]|nr:hypothetical protein [Acidimicrobiia bacterium]
MDEWILLGSVVRLQIHRTEIVYGGEYHVEHLARVESLWLTQGGVVGLVGGAAVLDYHHRDHPDLTKFKPGRQLSIGFTGHYDVMRNHFGDVPLGIAAESIVVDHPGQLTEPEVSAGLRIQTKTGPIDLAGASVAKPCLPFTGFLLGPHADQADIVGHRPLLDGGVRGFVMSLAGLQNGGVMVNEGDQVFRRLAV